MKPQKFTAIKSKLDELSAEYTASYSARVDLSSDETMKSVVLLAFEDDVCGDFWNFAEGEKMLSLPQTGDALINTKIADTLNVSVGDTIEVRNAEMQTLSVKVSRIFDNYAGNYIVLSPDSITDKWGECESNTLFICTEKSAEEIISMEGISSISSTADSKESVDSALSCLNYIIWLIVLFSGALAFIVIYNLTNINIAERSREIATVILL